MKNNQFKSLINREIVRLQSQVSEFGPRTEHAIYGYSNTLRNARILSRQHTTNRFISVIQMFKFITLL